ncbi:hypothetical protein RRG08_056192 [Elysia crispata]|uniref:Uncharacterized protein n=1 Tax=Elysia crispata TaxID=231223 RepID=A0AAE1D8X7_9GAST|nr:hypothetical protein RRG08_056192 [Elysia crispata]
MTLSTNPVFYNYFSFSGTGCSKPNSGCRWRSGHTARQEPGVSPVVPLTAGQTSRLNRPARDKLQMQVHVLTNTQLGTALRQREKRTLPGSVFMNLTMQPQKLLVTHKGYHSAISQDLPISVDLRQLDSARSPITTICQNEFARNKTGDFHITHRYCRNLRPSRDLNSCSIQRWSIAPVSAPAGKPFSGILLHAASSPSTNHLARSKAPRPLKDSDMRQRLLIHPRCLEVD